MTNSPCGNANVFVSPEITNHVSATGTDSPWYGDQHNCSDDCTKCSLGNGMDVQFSVSQKSYVCVVFWVLMIMKTGP